MLELCLKLKMIHSLLLLASSWGSILQTTSFVYNSRQSQFTRVPKETTTCPFCHGIKNDRTVLLLAMNDEVFPKKETKKSRARIVAVAALSSSTKKTQRHAFTVQQLETNPDFLRMEEQRDRSFARNLVSTVERRMNQIDSVLSMCADQYPPKKGKYSALLQACLRVGAAQILFLKTPSFAAVKETVEVLRNDKTNQVPEPMIKFVNAVLRRIGRDGLEMLEKHTTAADNISPWLVKQWQLDWGDENTEKICQQMFVEPHVDLSVKTTNQDIHPLCDALDAHILPNGSSIRVSSERKGAVSNWPHYEDGTWWVQDVSSTLPAIALIQELQRNNSTELSQLNVVDMCAAPGGKTAQLLSAGFQHVTAIEANARRCRRLKENLDRLQFSDQNYTIVVSEGQKWNGNESETIAGLLVDVPCSATGTGSRRPDVLRKNLDLQELLVTQETIANHCADNLLSKGGIMIYATCSLLKEESENQVQKLLDRGKKQSNNHHGNEPTIAVLETIPFLPGDINGFDAAIDSNGWLRVLPGVLDGNLKDCDGFFVAKLQKIL